MKEKKGVKFGVNSCVTWAGEKMRDGTLIR